MQKSSYIYILSNELFANNIHLVGGTSDTNLMDHVSGLGIQFRLPMPFSILKYWATMNLSNELSAIEHKLSKHRINPEYPYYKISASKAIEIISNICSDYGYIYVLSNPSMKGILKIGFTLRDVHNRVHELNNTNLPTPFVIEKIYGTFNPQKIEKAIHELLLKYRVNNSREFFRIGLSEAIELILINFNNAFFTISENDKDISEKNIELAKKYYSDGLALIRSGNLHDAIKKIKKSANLGYIEAIAYLHDNNYTIN